MARKRRRRCNVNSVREKAVIGQLVHMLIYDLPKQKSTDSTPTCYRKPSMYWSGGARRRYSVKKIPRVSNSFEEIFDDMMIHDDVSDSLFTARLPYPGALLYQQALKSANGHGYRPKPTTLCGHGRITPLDATKGVQTMSLQRHERETKSPRARIMPHPISIGSRRIGTVFKRSYP